MSNVYNPTVKKINNVTKVINENHITEELFTVNSDTVSTVLLNTGDPRYFEIIKFNGDGTQNIRVSLNEQAWFSVPDNALLSDFFGERVKYAGTIYARQELTGNNPTEVYVAYA